MKKILFLCIVVFLISGCEIPQDSALKSAEDSGVAIEESVAVTEELPFSPVEERIEVESTQVKVEAIVLAKEEEIPVSRTNEEIIKENRWGFSIYDPKTGTIEYYASKGGYLGKRALN